MMRARLNHGWQGHAAGSIVEGEEAEAAVAGGAAVELGDGEDDVVVIDTSPTHTADPAAVVTGAASAPPEETDDQRDRKSARS